MKTLLSKIQMGDMLACYWMSEEKRVELVLLPERMEHMLKPAKADIDSMVQLKAAGDDFPFGFANGQTMRNCETTNSMFYVSQTVEENDEGKKVITKLKNKNNGLEAAHIVEYSNQYPVLRSYTALTNKGREAVEIEMLSSFSLAGVTPFEPDEAAEQLLLHRIRSKWSNEGRVETSTIEELQLEPSWAGWGVQSEKYGVVGSMPVRKYFPLAAVEDTKNQVVWAVMLEAAASWQIEVYRRDENLCISGGLADYDFGHWKKILRHGEAFQTPCAYLTVHNGGFDDACQRLVSIQKKALKGRRAEQSLPVLFNEYCTTWGNPSQQMITGILEALKGKGIDYFIIDAGWYADPVKGWEANMGDWNIYEELFPDGLQKMTETIRAAGMRPGIWFEMEVIGRDAQAFQLTEHMLKRSQKVITAGNRRFWDMRDEWTFRYLTEKMIGFLRHYGFEYVKIDYNESIGIGCDGAESLGEGLRQNMEATRRFIRKIREEVPGIVIEICSSGGHRLEPSMMSLADFLSFSDAHEEKEIPVIASNLHRAVLPQQSQVWAVIREKDSLQRIVYSLVGAMYGVMCLSGEVCGLNDGQWKMLQEGMNFYRKISPVIRDGRTEFFGSGQTSYRKLKGWNGIIRYAKDEKAALVLIHSFENEEELVIRMPVRGNFQIVDRYQSTEHNICMKENMLEVRIKESFDAAALYLLSDEKDDI